MGGLSLLRRLAVLAFGACLALGAAAQAPAPALTADDLSAWLDGMMPSALRMAGVPGAVVVVVKDGKPLVEKGYGFADWDKSVPVDPASTLFRPGSVSKLFIWTAVMQLVEQGRLDLDADLNRYLDFTVPRRNGKALTLRHVMTHTTGLEETMRDLIVHDGPARDNGAVLKSYIPPYLYDPGTTQGYSNWATALAAYIVQRTSGLPFEDYVERHVFAPLGMSQSSFRQPLPATLRAGMSQGYPGAGQAPKGFETISMAPAGSLAASGADMARFMLAYLRGGELDGRRILAPETVRMMHTRITRGLPDLAGIGLGFYQKDMNGRRAVGHGGSTILFHSDLILLPDEGIGIFVSVNSPGNNGLGRALREHLYEGFADRYLPDTRPSGGSTVDPASAEAHARLLAGAYRNTRREDSTFQSILQLLSPTRVQALGDGRIALETGGSRVVFREVAPFLWKEVNGKRRVQAIVEDGKVVRWGLEPYVFAFVFEPVPFMASTPVLAALLCALGVVLATMLAWPVAAWMRRRHGLPAPPRSLAWVRAASCLVLLSAALWALAVAGMVSGEPGRTLLPAQVVSWLALVGGLAAALWHARTAAAGAAKARALALPVVWVLCFAILVAVGGYHKLLSFNPHY